MMQRKRTDGLRAILLATLCLSVLVGYNQVSRADDKESTDQPRHKKGLVDEYSGQNYGLAGCGLGSIIFGDHPGAVQLFAVTTNDFYSNNTFAASSGTSNCADDNSSESAATQAFVNTNRVAMQNDVARGSGEFLNAFYDVAACQNRAEVSTVLRKNYDGIFQKNVNDEQLVKAIRHTIRENQATALSCAKLG